MTISFYLLCDKYSTTTQHREAKRPNSVEANLTEYEQCNIISFITEAKNFLDTFMANDLNLLKESTCTMYRPTMLIIPSPGL